MNGVRPPPWSKALALFVAVILTCGLASIAEAAYVLRFTTTTTGAITFTGNSLGLSKANGANGSIGAFSTINTGLTDGTYPAGTTANWTLNSATSVLTIPVGSTVLYAELVWGGSYSFGGENVSANLNSSVTMTTPAGSSSVSPSGTTAATLGTAGGAGTCATSPCFYVRSADVTAQVQAGGSGSYTVGGVPGTQGTSEENNNHAGWTLAVVYSNPSLPARNMNVFVGAEIASSTQSTPAPVSGFCTPPTGPHLGRLMVSAAEGDATLTGDQMTFGPTALTRVPIFGTNNPVANFFQSQINGDTGALVTSGTFGTRNHTVGTPGTNISGGRQGWDISNIDVSTSLLNAQTTAVAQGTSSGDTYVINALGLQVNVGAPVFPAAVKTVDKATTFVGDTLRYTVVLDNTAGTADAANVVFTDTPPPGTSFVANSLTVGGIVQLSANPANGFNIGTVPAGQSRSVSFQVTVNSIPAAPAVAQYSNAASWTYQYVSCAGQPTINGSTTTNPVVTTIARLVPVKSVSPAATVFAGQTLTYTISVPNTGTANSSGSTLQDAIPAGTTYVAASTTLNGGAVADVAGVMPFVVARQFNSPTRAAGQINIGETATVTFQVTVNGGATGTISNTANIDVDGAGLAPAQTAGVSSSVGILAPTKTASPTGAVAPAQTVVYTITVPNNGSGNTAGTTLTDAIPANTTYVANSTTLNGAAVADSSGVMPFVSANAINSPTRPAGQINAGETATVRFSVLINTSPGAGPIVNTASIDPDGPGTAAAVTAQASSAIVRPDLVMTKSHSGNFVAGSTGSYTLSVANAAAAGQVSSGAITVTDTLPTGLTVAAVPGNASWNCSATVMGSSSASCTYSGAYPVVGGTTLPAITLSVSISPATASSVTNSATVSTAAGETSTANNTATDPTSVAGKPTIVKSFSPASMAVNGTSTLTLTVTNPSALALTGLAFTDTFPSGLTIAATPALTNSCSGSITGGASGNNMLNLSGGSLAASGTCTLTVSVTAAATGVYNNNTSGVASNEAGAGGTTSNVAQLTVLSPPQISKAFVPDVILPGGVSTLTITIANNNALALTGVAFTDNYPANLRNVLVPIVANTCGGSTTGGASLGTSIGLTGGTIPGNSTCAVSVQVTSSVRASYANTTGAVTSTNGGTGNTASATLIVAGNPSLLKTFTPAAITAGGTSVLNFTIVNASVLPITNVSFTDVFPAGMVIAATPGLSNSCGGSITGGAAGNNNINLVNGVLGTFGVCNISVTVTVAAGGTYTNTTSAITSSAGTGDASNSSILVVTAPITIVKAFNPGSIAANANSTMSFVLSNANAVAVSNVAFTDIFPAGGLQVATTPNLTNNCGGTVNGATAGSTTVSLSGGAFGANSSCTITMVVTSPVPGAFVNTTTGVSSNQTLTGIGASAVLLTVVSVDLRLTKTHTGNFTVGTNGAYQLVVNNSLGTAPTLGTITVLDTLPTGLTYVSAGSGGAGWSCSASGQLVTCTSNAVIGAGATSGDPITVNVLPDATAVPRVTNSASVSGGAEPAGNTGNNEVFDPTNVSAPAQNSFQPDGAQTALPGTTIFFTHIFNAGLSGNVAFSSSHVASPAITGWSQVLYRDNDCNSIIDGADANAPLSGSVTVVPGDRVCIVVKEFVPAGAPYSAQDIVTVTATFTPPAGAAQIYTRTDTTIVGDSAGAGLSLQKTVRNVTTGGVAATANVARPGETLEYMILYANNGNGALASVVLNDSTPAFTVFVSATCAAPLPANISACNVTSQPSGGATGAIVWTLTGTLAPSQSGNVSFRVLLQ